MNIDQLRMIYKDGYYDGYYSIVYKDARGCATAQQYSKSAIKENKRKDLLIIIYLQGYRAGVQDGIKKCEVTRKTTNRRVEVYINTLKEVKKMKKFLVGILAVCFIVCGAMSAKATVLTFDDLSTGNTIGVIQDGYGGLNWDDMGYLSGTRYSNNNGYINSVVSGEFVAFNEHAHMATVDNTGFDFNGAYLTGAWNNGLNICVIGSLNNDLMYTQTVTVDSTGPTWFDFNYLNIDSLTFSSHGGTNAGYGGSGEHFAMDNFTFNEPLNAAPVPEPCTMLLLGTGIAGLGIWKRKKTIK